MPIISKDRPDQRYYKNIVQGDDGNWSSEQMHLDDDVLTIGAEVIDCWSTYRSGEQVSQAGANVNSGFATAADQRNALYI
jgi:hypothetical protein